MSSDDDNDKLKEKLGQLRRGFIVSLPVQIKDIQKHWEQVRNTAGDDESLRTLYRMVHSLVGSSGTFGMNAISSAARNLEQHLKRIMDAEGPVGAAEEAIARALLLTLVQTVQAALKQEGRLREGERLLLNDPPPNHEGKTVFLVESDQHVSEFIALNLENAGYRVQAFPDTAAAKQAIEHHRPDALILDMLFPEGQENGLAAVAAIRAMHHLSIPVIFLSARDDLETRLQAVRAGGDAYLLKPVDMEELLQRLEEVIPRITQRMRILVVEDDTHQADYYALGLRQGGMEVETLDDPKRILDVLASFKPDMILMDLYLPDIRGDELAALIRQDKDYSDIPIIYLSTEADLDQQLDALRQGGDDFLVKPVALEQLLEAVQARLRRVQELAGHVRLQECGQSAHVSAGKSDRERFMQALETLPVGKEAPRHAMLFVKIDDYPGLRQKLGVRLAEKAYAELANLLRQSLGPQDSICRCTGAALAVLLREHTPQEARELAESMRERVAGHVFRVDGEDVRITCSLGLAFSGEDEKDAFDLLERADTSCTQAQAAGGNQVQEYHEQAAEPVRDEQQELWEGRIREALEKQGFFLVYQPIVSLHGEAVENYEVLLRMRAEDNDSYLPGQFLPAAARAGLLQDIDHWVLEEAAKRLAYQQEQNQQERFFVKLSEASLVSPDLTGWINEVMARHGLFGHNLVFELAEHDAGANLHETIQLGRELVKRGCGMLIEHFTGEERAFKLVEMLPVNYVRLHRDLISHLKQEPARRRLEQVVGRLRAADRKCIASFIEDAEILTFLFKAGVGYVQGFFTQAPSELLLYDFQESMAGG